MGQVVQSDSYVTLRYRLSVKNALADSVGDQSREIISTIGQKPATLQLGLGQLAEPLEQRMFGMKEGEHGSFELPAGEAFGLHNAQMVQRVNRSVLVQHGDPDERYAVGEAVQFPAPGAEQGGAMMAALVTKVADDWVEFDFNHPLAGQAVTFEVEIIGIM
jgi:FKBP-type peptidyl-prolyl cis-trans isomerase SlpA